MKSANVLALFLPVFGSCSLRGAMQIASKALFLLTTLTGITDSVSRPARSGDASPNRDACNELVCLNREF
jgi:hypothetical protein